MALVRVYCLNCCTNTCHVSPTLIRPPAQCLDSTQQLSLTLQHHYPYPCYACNTDSHMPRCMLQKNEGCCDATMRYWSRRLHEDMLRCQANHAGSRKACKRRWAGKQLGELEARQASELTSNVPAQGGFKIQRLTGICFSFHPTLYIYSIAGRAEHTQHNMPVNIIKVACQTANAPLAYHREHAIRSTMLTASAKTRPTAPAALMQKRLAARWATENATRSMLVCWMPRPSSTACTNASVIPVKCPTFV